MFVRTMFAQFCSIINRMERTRWRPNKKGEEGEFGFPRDSLQGRRHLLLPSFIFGAN